MNLINYWKDLRARKLREMLEDSLKFIYSLQESDTIVDAKKLSELSGLSIKKQEELLKTLLQRGLTDSENRLSPDGEQYALQIIRRHRLFEKHLSENSGYDASEWHARACKEEHKLSENEQEELANRLGNPLFDPHGDPIPSAEGELLKVQGQGLEMIQPDSYALITHIEDEPMEDYKVLAEIGLYRDALIYVANKEHDKLLIRFEGEEFQLSANQQKLITAVLCSDENRIANEQKSTRLSKLKLNEQAEVMGISRALRGANRRRLLDLGFVRGSTISIDLFSPLGNPRAYLVRGSSIALRSDQARYILVNKLNPRPSASVKHLDERLAR